MGTTELSRAFTNDPLEFRATAVTRPTGRALTGGAAGIAVFALGLWLAMTLRHLVPGVALVATGAVVAIAVPFATMKSRRNEGILRAQRDKLSFDGVPVLGGRPLRQAIAYTNGDRHGVAVSTRWSTSFFELPSRAQADEVVHALGKDGQQAAIAIGGQAAAVAGFVNVGTQFINHRLSALGIGLAMLIAFLVPAAVYTLTKTRWTIGNDGLLARRGLGKKRFVAYRDIEEIIVDGATVKVSVREGVGLTLTTVDDSKASSWPVIGAQALTSRIESARLAASTGAASDLGAELARGDREVSAWMASLAELLDRPATYRLPAVARQALWEALEDVAQPAVVRAAAAMALRSRLTGEERPRLRVAIAACASPRLRVALEAANEGNDDQLERAIVELEQESKAARL